MTRGHPSRTGICAGPSSRTPDAGDILFLLSEEPTQTLFLAWNRSAGRMVSSLSKAINPEALQYCYLSWCHFAGSSGCLAGTRLE